MGALRAVQIIDCQRLEFAPLPFEEMNQLYKVEILNCPKMRIPTGSTEGMSLPSSLQVLTVGQCGDLEHKILGSLQGLTNLHSLHLESSLAVQSLPPPDVFKSLELLQRIKINGCRNLSSMGGLGSLSCLRWIEITDSCKLEEIVRDVSVGEEEHREVSRSSWQIEFILIDSPLLLHVEPLNSLCQTKDLLIWDGSGLASLPERWLLQNNTSLKFLSIMKACSLESLPPSIRDLSSLQGLFLSGAAKLRSLPDLPSSLRGLIIRECHSKLERKARERGSPEWNKISHVSFALIGNSCFIMGKPCSWDTYVVELYRADDNALTSWANQPQGNGNCFGSALNGRRKLCCLRSEEEVRISPLVLDQMLRRHLSTV